MALLKFLFLLFLAVFPLGQLTRIDLGNNIAIVVSDIVLVFLFVFWLVFKSVRLLRPDLIGARNDNNLLSSFYLTRPILIFLSVAIFSLVVNLKNLEFNQFIVSFLYILRFIIYASLYFVVSGFDSKFKQKIPYFMLISGFFIILIGYIQYFFYPNLRNLYYLGWDEHLYRMFSTILDPNFAGAFFVLYFMLTLGLLARPPRPAKRDWRCGQGGLGGLSLIAVFLTHSRSAMLMLLFSVFTFLTLTKKLWILIPFIILFLVSAFLLQNSKIENLNLFRTASSEARIGSSITALKIIKENPVLGVGFNAYRYAQIRYGFKDVQSSLKSHADAGTDNSFLFVLATTGIIGFFAYIYLWFKALSINFKSYKEEKSFSFNKMISIIIISSLVGLFIDSLFINSLFYPVILQWLWILLGLSVIRK